LDGLVDADHALSIASAVGQSGAASVSAFQFGDVGSGRLVTCRVVDRSFSILGDERSPS
jgi:hypothetical protein